MFQLCSGGLKVYRGGGAPAHRKWCYFNNEERTLYHVFHWKGTQVGNSSGFFYHLDIQEGTRGFCFKHGVPCTPSESTSATFLFLKVRFRHTNYLLRVRTKESCFGLKYLVLSQLTGKCPDVLLKYLVLLPQTWLENVSKSCWKYLVQLPQRSVQIVPNGH